MCLNSQLVRMVEAGFWSSVHDLMCYSTLFIKVSSIILFLHNSGSLISGDYYFDYMK